MTVSVQPHNVPAAAAWSAGGRDYDAISEQISDALQHAVQRLWPRPGEHVLDVATGTGWTARNVARKGARVTGVDIAEELLKAARDLSGHIQPPIEFRHADAEQLPFADSTFDAAISTFGVMFAGNQEQAARELARACKPGGRLVLATWDPEGYVGKFFQMIGRYNPAPPPAISPLEWGRPERVRALLGQAFDLRFEPGITHCYFPNGAAVWEVFAKGFGPIIRLCAALDAARREEFKREFIAEHDKHMTEPGLKWGREYLLTMGKRR